MKKIEWELVTNHDKLVENAKEMEKHFETLEVNMVSLCRSIFTLPDLRLQYIHLLRVTLFSFLELVNLHNVKQ
jgi:hypothetical protein